MLELAEDTRDDWADEALAHLDEILLDHAHCEKKAAGAALKLLFSYPDTLCLQEPLSRLAREELGHFEQILKVLRARGVAFKRQRPSPYGGRLHAHVRRDEPERLMDLLLVGALIEARSCERFRLLAAVLPDPALAQLYRGLLACEERHGDIYVDLCEGVAGEERARERLRELADAEAAILRERAPVVRLHT
ncbi:MAG: tRNA-(ms[2]io[6]A)-hydroxylase [Deltaproteobacteria bacterium]|nr:tRNA-(ms[2]io[6]A)-hydroxylase [Deltaproteobacteria bacterium]MBW2417741.1 tRNA-(ms[2]io[6]A)-hydroxylase [Deltaproteobacteria bacterium]